MQSNKFFCLTRFRSQLHLDALLMLWAGGIILGTTLGAEDSAIYFSLMRRSVATPVSIVGLGVCCALPFLFTAAVAWTGYLRLIYFFSFFKGYTVGFTGAICLTSYGTGGWLIRLLLLFPQLAVLPALWFIWLKLCRGENTFSVCGICSLIGYLLAAFLVNYFLVAPFLARLV